MPSWDPEQYLGFAAERERPFSELLARVRLVNPERIVDLGCGPGSTTATLLTRWPSASVLGVDSSPAMLERAAELADPPLLSFELGDIASWEPDEPVDLVVSNAALHWVPGHLERLGRLLSFLAPGGVLAMQVPANFSAPSHRLLAELAERARAEGRLLAAPEPVESHPAEEYLRRLVGLGAAVDAWETTYLHVLDGEDPVLSWVRGTALRPLLEALGEDDARALELVYAAALRSAYPRGPGGITVFPFSRVFVVARRR